MMMNESVTKLYTEAKHLIALCADPQPGCSTWFDAVVQRMQNIQALAPPDKDAERYRWLLDNPDVGYALFNLLKDGKGDKVAFSKMLDRITASKNAADAARRF